MTDPLYTRAVATATRLLTKYGQTLTHTPHTAGTYDTSTGTSTPGAPGEVTRVGALFDFGAGQTKERGELILSSDKRLLLDSAVPAPSQLDHFTDAAGNRYSVVSFIEINPAGVPVMYDAHVRKQ